MRLPRDLSGRELVEKLKKLDYVMTRQSGSHMRVTTQRNGEHHVCRAPVKLCEPHQTCKRRPFGAVRKLTSTLRLTQT